MMDNRDSSSLASWFVAVRRHEISDLPNIELAANANMLTFELPPVVDVPEIYAALERVYSEYRKKIERAGKAGLFYAWVDEMSGTIRCSFSEVSELSELPFRCFTKKAISLAEIASVAGRSYSDGIPAQELVEVEWSNPDDSEELELLVFAERVGVVDSLGTA